MPSKGDFFFFSGRGCVFFFLLVILILGLGAGAILAKTGLASIPLLSQVFYTPNAPSRKLNIDPGRASAAPVIDWSGKAGQGEVVISETEASAILNLFSRQRHLKISDLQVVFLAERAEIYFTLREPRPTAIKILLRPELRRGKFDLTLERLELGSLSIPTFIFNLAAKTIFQNKINELEKAIQSSSLESLSLGNQELILRFGGSPVQPVQIDTNHP